MCNDRLNITVIAVQKQALSLASLLEVEVIDQSEGSVGGQVMAGRTG